MENIISTKMICCFFILKDIIFSYFMWVLYRRTKKSHYKIGKGEAVKKLFEQKNRERGGGR